MDRIIEVKVNGTYLSKDSQLAGVQGEVNASALRIEFDAGWDGFAKTLTWWDAKGENPTGRVLTADLLENMMASTRVYLCPIPAEPLAVWGQCMFAIEGYINGKRQRSIYAKLVVKGKGDGQDVTIEEPSPSQIEQLQVQIDTILEDMQDRAVRAENAARAAEASEREATEARDDILDMSVSAQTVSPYAPASVVKTEKDGVAHLHFSIPHGMGGVYVGSEGFPEGYEVKVNPKGSRVVDYIQDIMDEGDRQLERLSGELGKIIPYVGSNGHWYVWDVDANGYVDSGISAQGPAGAGTGDMLSNVYDPTGRREDIFACDIDCGTF